MWSVLFFIFAIFWPTFVSTYMYCNWKDLDKEKVRRRCVDLYSTLQLTQGKWVIYEPLLFLVRRFLLAITVIFIQNLFLQYLIYTCFIWLSVVLVGY